MKGREQNAIDTCIIPLAENYTTSTVDMISLEETSSVFLSSEITSMTTASTDQPSEVTTRQSLIGTTYTGQDDPDKDQDQILDTFLMSIVGGSIGGAILVIVGGIAIVCLLKRR